MANIETFFIYSDNESFVTGFSRLHNVSFWFGLVLWYISHC